MPNAAEPKDHHLHVGDVRELVEEALGGAEEQGAIDAIDRDALMQQPLLRSEVDLWRDLDDVLPLDARLKRHAPQREQRCHGDAELDGEQAKEAEKQAKEAEKQAKEAAKAS